MFDFIKRCFKYRTLRELIDSYKQPSDSVKVERVGDNHIKATVDLGSIPKSAFTSENFERYRKESEREIREIERGEFLEKQAHKMRQITVAAVTVPKSIHGELLIRLHSEIQELSEKDFQESARMAYVDMFTGPFRLQETPGAKRFFSTYRANRHLELVEIVKINIPS